MTPGSRGSRLPYLRYDELDARGQEVWDRRGQARAAPSSSTPTAGLIGPFNAFVHAPGVGRHLSALGGRPAFSGRQLTGVSASWAIITVGGRMEGPNSSGGRTLRWPASTV